MKNWLILVMIAVATSAIYLVKLADVPVHLNQDELGFVINAAQIAKTGYDESGRFLPLYFWHLGVMYSTPIVVYATSLILLVLPVSEWSIRLPSVFFGVVDVLLIYLIAHQLFQNKKYAVCAAIILATTPAHFIHSRILLDNLYPVPFVLSWFYAMLKYNQHHKSIYLLLSGLFLGIGIHSYHAAKIIMPLYLIASYGLLFGQYKTLKLKLLYPLIGFILPIIPLFFWLQKYPDTLTDQVKYTGLYDTSLGPLQGLLSLLKPEILWDRLRIYASYYNPEFLFFTGDSSLIHSTHTAGVFLLPLAVLIPLGIFQTLRNSDRWKLLLLFGFFSAPIAAAFVGNQFRISKSLVMLPFAALLSVYGMQYLQRSKFQKYLPHIATVVMSLILFHSALFIRDYFTVYPKQSYTWFNYNIPGALERTIKLANEKQVDHIYLDNQIWFIERYWKFYLLKHNALDLLEKTVYLDASQMQLSDSQPASYTLRFDHYLPRSGIEPEHIREPDGTTSFYVYTK